MSPEGPTSIPHRPIARGRRVALLVGLGLLGGWVALRFAGDIFAGPLAAVGRFITADDPVEPADIIFVLNGRVSVRARHAVDLYRSGLGEKIVIARAGGHLADYSWTVTDFLTRDIELAGVDSSAIVILEGAVDSTVDEARALRAFVEKEGVRRVIVATTDYHSRRAGWVVRRELRHLAVEVRISGAANPDGITADNWWRTARGRQTYREELVKLAGTVTIATIAGAVGRR